MPTRLPAQAFGTGLNFANNSKAQVNSNAGFNSLTSTLTLEAWVSAGSSTSNNGEFIKKDLQYILRQDIANGALGFHIWIGGVEKIVTASTLSAGVWTHVAGTYDGATMKLYVNGTSVGQTSTSGSVDTNANVVTLGNQSGLGEQFKGSIDEVRMSTIVRYSSNFTPSTNQFVTDASTVALWHLDENTGSTAADSSGNANTLTLTGSPGWVQGGVYIPGNGRTVAAVRTTAGARTAA